MSEAKLVQEVRKLINAHDLQELKELKDRVAAHESTGRRLGYKYWEQLPHEVFDYLEGGV